MSAIEIKNFTKKYSDKKMGNKVVIDAMNLTIPRGQFFGLLGANGAGKTSTINAITGVISITEGSIKVMGHNVVTDYRLARTKIGVSPQEFTVDGFQTVDEILDYSAGFFGILGRDMEKRRDEMLKQFELIEHRDKKFNFLSGGLKRRATLAKAMMHDPEVLILDEPTAGVDVETRRTLWKFLKDLHKGGKTIILTSHYLEEVEALCERVAIINGGKIILDDDMKTLTKDHKLEDVYIRATEEDNQKIANNNK
jgi:ABC-2 type transport system ATP-binding protein